MIFNKQLLGDADQVTSYFLYPDLVTLKKNQNEPVYNIYANYLLKINEFYLYYFIFNVNQTWYRLVEDKE